MAAVARSSAAVPGLFPADIAGDVQCLAAVFPYQSPLWRIFDAVVLNTEEALAHWTHLKQQADRSGCQGCQDPSFSQILLDFVLVNDLDNEDQQKKTADVTQFLRDGLRDLPASTVQVEKLHAGLQAICRSDKNHAPRHKTVHINSYIMTLCHQHAAIKGALEDEVLGANKKKALRLLSARALQSSAPTKLSIRRVTKPNKTCQQSKRRLFHHSGWLDVNLRIAVCKLCLCTVDFFAFNF